MRIDGQCHCGAIRYRAEIDPKRVVICHCTDCQAFSGSAFRVSVSSPRDALEVEGEPKTYVKLAESGRRRLQQFCGDCGAALFASGDGEAAKVVGIRWGSVRQRRELIPTHQTWRRSAPNWVCAFEGLETSLEE
jgi:hypothetical protein